MIVSFMTGFLLAERIIRYLCCVFDRDGSQRLVIATEYGRIVRYCEGSGGGSSEGIYIWPKSKAFGSDDDCLCVLKTRQETDHEKQYQSFVNYGLLHYQ